MKQMSPRFQPTIVCFYTVLPRLEMSEWMRVACALFDITLEGLAHIFPTLEGSIICYSILRTDSLANYFNL